MTTLTIQYFGMIAEKTGKNSEVIEASQTTIRELLEMIEAKYTSIKGLTFNIAINNKIVSLDTKIDSNATIAIMPPFAGG